METKGRENTFALITLKTYSWAFQKPDISEFDVFFTNGNVNIN